MTHSNHSLTVFRRCPREYYYRYALRRKPRYDGSDASDIGGLVHSLIEKYLNNRAAVHSLTSIVAMCDTPQNTIAAELFFGWVNYWNGFQRSHILFVEHEFKWKEFIGRFDAIGEDGLGPFVIEHKTVSKSAYGEGDEYQSGKRLDTQVAIYLAAASELCGAPVNRIVYDVLVKPDIRPLEATPIDSRKYTKEGKLYANQRAEPESLEEFANRLRPQLDFHRFEVYITEQALDEQLEELRETIAVIESGASYRNPDACKRFNQLCWYFDVCTGCESIDSPRFVTGGRR